jgi:hypothetical protein
MIAKAKASPGGSALFSYVVNDKKGYELLRNDLSGTSPSELHSDMAIFHQQNLRCTNNVISIVLSPTIEDGKIKSEDELKKLTKDFLNEMNLDPKNNQFIAFVHTEKEHKHIHILMNRVQKDGTLIKDNRIGLKAQQAAHIVALKNGWVSARDIKLAKEIQEKHSNKSIKKEIKEAHFQVLSKKPDSLKTYMREMAKRGVAVLPTINRQGKIQGFRFIHEATGTNLKASEVDRNLKLNEMFSNENPIKLSKSTENQPFEDWKLNNEVLKTFSSILNIMQGASPEYDQNLRRKKRRYGPKR